MAFESDNIVEPAAVASKLPSELDAAFGDEVAFRTWYERSLPRV